MVTIGNEDILKLHKTAFLCSRRYPSTIVTKAYDWAIAQRNAGNCVISGFQSQIEKDVLGFLLKGKQSVIIVWPRKLYKKVPELFAGEIEKGRMLIISALPSARSSYANAQQRNRLIIELADSVVVAHASTGGGLERLINHFDADNSKISFL
jgi:predicted Rossmann fold nucleotide-binding protein DprA/Smf involved in DNA uptake